MPTYRRDSGLFVAERVQESADVERALSLLDHPIAGRLFLTREVDRAHGCFVWRTMIDNGDQVAECLCEWRDASGRPLPLSHGLVDKVRELIQRADRGDQVVADLEQANDQHRQRVRRDVDDAFDEIAHDVGPRISDLHSPLLHRGVYLRRSRDKSLSSGRDERRRVVGERLRRIAEG